MLFRWSPWAAVRKRYTSRSLRKAIPNVAPAPDWTPPTVGTAAVALPCVNGIGSFGEKFARPPPWVPTRVVPDPREKSGIGLTIEGAVGTCVAPQPPPPPPPVVPPPPPRLPP